ncbi:tetratricopeptide repeat protein [Lentzea sp. NPDC051838]|uniref:ATP-binding protein n=1 Tax=Lentzea sp. NPDC051838 TaxID=3154849 RepID=UPI00341F614E
MSGESRQAALHRALAAQAGQPVLFGDLVSAVWGDDPPSNPLPALRNLVKRLRQSVDDEIVTDASGYRLVVRPPAPQQLPADLLDFVGREDELAALEASEARVHAITGPPGIGKTALAVRLAHRIRDRFPDGQLHVDLRGFATGPAVTLEQALGRFLRALGVPPAKVPLDLDEQVELYRAKLKGRRVLVLLDNAAELSPLVPGVEGCTAIVTSRNELQGQIRLDVLAGHEATQLLDRWQIEGSREDHAELIKLCARLPLALRIAGAQLADRHLPDYLADLRGGGRLDALEIEGDAAVRAAFALSYKALPDDARKLFGLLSVHPGTDFDLPDTAVLSERSTEDTAGLVDVLVRAGLVQRADERFQLHDLIRLFASEQMGAEGPAAVRRLMSYYLDTALHASDLAATPIKRLDRLPLELTGRRFESSAQAQEWLDEKRSTLVAAVAAAPHPFSVHLADSLRGYLIYGGYQLEADASLAAGLASARGEGDVDGETAMLNGRGQLYSMRGSFSESLEAYREAAGLATSDSMRATLLTNMGALKRETGDLTGALADLEEALRMARGEPPLHVTVLFILGSVLGARAELRKAIRYFEEAMRLGEEHGFKIKIAVARESMGLAFLELGQYDEALRHLEAALADYEELKVARAVPNVLVNLADTAAATGDAEQAQSLASRALEGARENDDARTRVDALIVLGDVEAAVELANRINYPIGRHKAQLLLAGQDAELASELLRDVRDNGDLLTEAKALLALAEATGDAAAAREALELAKEREQSAVAARAETFLGSAQPPANGGSTSS